MGKKEDEGKWFHIYGRNRYSKNLILHERNIPTREEARKALKAVRESAGHDYTFRIVTTNDQMRWV